MRVGGIVWLRDVVDKLAFKHHVETDEVEPVLNGKPKFRFVEKGERKGENIHGIGTNQRRALLGGAVHL